MEESKVGSFGRLLIRQGSSTLTTSEVVQIISLYMGFSADVGKLKWFSFDLALNLPL